MRRFLLFVLFLLVGVCTFLSAQQIDSMFDDSVDRSLLDVRRVAIIPNRLPLVLQEPEMWRLSNWELLAAEFRGKGYDVLGYEQTVGAARQANLPLEDTLSSEAKFAEFCRITDTDMVIMPYYGTGFTSSTFLLMATRHNYTSMVSYQYYTPRENIFFHRADASATTGYTTGLGILLGTATSVLGTAMGQPEIGYAGAGIMLAGLLVDTIRALRPPTAWWENSFEEAVPTAAEPILAYLQGAGGSGQTASGPSASTGTQISPSSPGSPPQGSDHTGRESPWERIPVRFGVIGGIGTDLGLIDALGGAFIDLSLSRWFSLKSELLMGNLNAEDTTESKDDREINVLTLQLPLLARLKLPVGESSALYVLAGPGVNIPVGDARIEEWESTEGNRG
ncbi:MAG: hypothetical protein R6V67_01120, partial [Spirochaetia bacterium]